MPTFTEPPKTTSTYTELQWTEMTWEMLGDITWAELGNQTWALWFGKLHQPTFTEPTKGTVTYHEPSK